MTKEKPFVDRRQSKDRRYEIDPCRDMPLDLYHRKRRKSTERRANRTLTEDYYAFSQANNDDACTPGITARLKTN